MVLLYSMHQRSWEPASWRPSCPMGLQHVDKQQAMEIPDRRCGCVGGFRRQLRPHWFIPVQPHTHPGWLSSRCGWRVSWDWGWVDPWLRGGGSRHKMPRPQGSKPQGPRPKGTEPTSWAQATSPECPCPWGPIPTGPGSKGPIPMGQN